MASKHDQAVQEKPCIHTIGTGKHEWNCFHWVHQAHAPFSYPQCPTCGWIDLDLMVKEAGLIQSKPTGEAAPLPDGGEQVDAAKILTEAHRAVEGDGIWFVPEPQSGWLHGCCDCGLTHTVEARIVDGKMEFRFHANPEATSLLREAAPRPDLHAVRERIEKMRMRLLNAAENDVMYPSPGVLLDCAALLRDVLALLPAEKGHTR